MARKLVITSECDTIIVSIAPKEEGNNELLLPWRFLVAARGCLLSGAAPGDPGWRRPSHISSPNTCVSFHRNQMQTSILPRQGGMTCPPSGLSWGKFTGPSNLNTVLVTEGWEGAFSYSHWKGGYQSQKKPHQTLMEV